MAGSACLDWLFRNLPKVAASVSEVSTRIAKVCAAAVQSRQASNALLNVPGELAR